MILQEIPEPDDVLIVGIEAEPDQGVNDAAHMHWLRTLVGFLKLLLDHIAGQEQFVLIKKLVLPVHLSALLDDFFQIEQAFRWSYYVMISRAPVLFFKGINR